MVSCAVLLDVLARTAQAFQNSLGTLLDIPSADVEHAAEVLHGSPARPHAHLAQLVPSVALRGACSERRLRKGLRLLGGAFLRPPGPPTM